MLYFAFVHTLIKSKRHKDHPMDLWVLISGICKQRKKTILSQRISIKLTHLHIASFNLFSPMLRKEAIPKPYTIDIIGKVQYRYYR